ncbi:MAG TPA: tetratricopeptide repeat protein [Saprospiraceae bacterium]|nr:tetratricopeptide repeat protein [Saprospiraceae bacterium]HRJ16067.1 tetratricopeptide repeat protein [Saprospiraceae bacterium]HRK80993.1 tetratricopeptide repeat protein [Saprospiraceae bacterium]
MYQLTTADMEILEQALNDQLSEEAIVALQRRLSEDPGFKTEAEHFLTTYAAMRTVRRERWRSHLKQQSSARHSRRSFPFTRRRWIWAAAAALALAGIAALLCPPASRQQSAAVLAAQEALDVPIWRGATMSEAAADPLRAQAGTAYNARRYKEAAGFLRSYFEQHPGPDADLELMLGVALLHAEQPDEALEILTRRKSNPDADPYETDWYRALALLLLQRGEEARSLLQSLSEAPNAYQSEAEKLMRKEF